MDREKRESILSKLTREVFNVEEDFTGGESNEQLFNAEKGDLKEKFFNTAKGEDGEINPIMNATAEMLWETMEPLMNPSDGKSLSDVIGEAVENAENEEEQE